MMKVVFGVGLYESYVRKLEGFVSEIADQPVESIELVIGDCLQEHNSELNQQRKEYKTRTLEDIESIIGKLEAKDSRITHYSWKRVRATPRFQQIHTRLNLLYNENRVFARQMRQITSQKLRLKPDETAELDMLANYGIEELAWIYTIAEQGNVWAVHLGESAFLKRAKKTLNVHGEKLGIRLRIEDIRVMYIG